MSQFISEDKLKSNLSYQDIFKKLFPYFLKNKSLFVFIVIAMLVGIISSRIQPNLMGKIIDQGILTHDMSMIKQLILIYFVVEIIKGFSQFLYQFYFQKFGNRILYLLREDLVRHTQHLPIQYFNKNPTGRIVNRLTQDVSNLAQLFTDGVIHVITETISLFAIIIAMLLISPKLTLHVLAVIPLFVFLTYKFSSQFKNVLRISKKQIASLNAFLAESLSGIKILRLYNRTHHFLIDLKGQAHQFSKTNLKGIRTYARLMPTLTLFNMTVISVSLYFGGKLSLALALPIGSVIAFISHAHDLISPIRKILDKYQHYQDSLTSAERVFQVFDEMTEFSAKQTHQQSIVGKIEFRNLSFRYEENLPFVFENFNLNIAQSSSVAFKGRTGGGKSTLAQLVLAFYPAPEQSVFIDDIAIENYQLENLRSQIGYIQQDPIIFRGTIRENLLMGASATDQELIHILRELEFEKSLDLFIEERGANLSQGEKQLIAFARILIMNPKILILDEATANIDSKTELLIQKATHKIIKNRTSIIIAHRLSTIAHCDQVITIG